MIVHRKILSIEHTLLDTVYLSSPTPLGIRYMVE